MLKRKTLGLGRTGKPKSGAAGSADRQVQPPSDSPGTLRGKARLIIQTRQAQRLITGRQPDPRAKRPPIPGLFTFAATLNRLWEAAALDDPYADWYLLRIADALETAQSQVQGLLKDTRARLPRQGVEVAEAETIHPVIYPLRFRSPYGFMGAYLIADFDTLVRAVLTARHVGLMSRAHGEQVLQEASRHIRRTLLAPAGWRNTRVTRRDLLEETETATKAREVMGEPPPEVMERAWRAKHAPTIRRPTTVQSTDSSSEAEE